MDSFDELKNIWTDQKTETLPTVSHINAAVKTYHADKQKNILILISISIFCFITMIWVMIDYKSTFWTTRIGESLFILLSFYLFFSKLKKLKKNRKEEFLSTKDYLEALKKKSKKEASSNSQTIIFILAAFALFLYIYEILATTKTQLAGYITLTFYLLLVWFVYRPWMIKRQHKKVENLLNKIENIKHQTDEAN